MTAPWVLVKSDTARLATVIFHIFESLKIVSGLIWPFMPQSAEKMQGQLGLPQRGKELTLDQLRAWGSTKPVRPIKRAAALFPRVEDKKNKGGVPGQGKMASSKAKMAMIPFSEFQKLDLRVATIKKAEKISGSKKLLQLTVDAGEDRTVVAGLAGHYDVEDLHGRQILIVANLEPAKLMGVESQGMLLAAEDASGLHLMIPDGTTEPGSRVK
jgi:methionyl-tRNA synthetase